MDEYACLVRVPRYRRARCKRAARARSSVPLAILSNGNPQMLDIAVKSAGMTGLFDHVLSVDAVRAYKPAPAAYALGTQAFGAAAARDRVRFVEWLGRRRRDMVRLHDVLAQPAWHCPPKNSASRRVAPVAAWPICSLSSTPAVRRTQHIPRPVETPATACATALASNPSSTALHLARKTV